MCWTFDSCWAHYLDKPGSGLDALFDSLIATTGGGEERTILFAQ